MRFKRRNDTNETAVSEAEDKGNSLPNIDLNCDLAQGWGAYQQPNEELLLPFVTSVNIACGAHAGDLHQISRAVKLAAQRELAIGAHVGYPDLNGAGQREIPLSNTELSASIVSQIGFLGHIAASYGVEVSYVKPQGAMHRKCELEHKFAEFFAQCVAQVSPWLILVAPAGHYLHAIHESVGIRTIGELELDATYRKDNTRRFPPAMKHQQLDAALGQARSLLYHNKLIIEHNKRSRVPFRSIYLGTDRSYSLPLAEQVHAMLQEQNRLAPVHGLHRFQNVQAEDFDCVLASANPKLIES